MKFSVLSLVFAVAAVLSGADAKTREVTFPVATPLTYLLDVGTGGSRCQQAEGSCIDLESGRCAHGASNIRAGLCPDPKASVKCCLPTSKLAKAEELGGRKTMVEKFHSGVGSGKRTIEISTKANEVEWVKVDGQRVSHRQDGLELHLGSNDAVISPATLSGLILVENNSKETTRLFWRDMEPSPETALMDGSIMVGLAHEFLDVFANRDSRILAGEDTSLTLAGWKAAAEPAKAAVQADVEEIRAMVQRHGESMTVLLNENSPTMKRIAEMKTVLESVKNAIDDAFTTLAKWSSSVEASFELPLAERENGKFLADAEAEAIFQSDEWTSFRAHLEEEPEAVKPGEPMTLSPRGEEFLKSAVNAATDKYIETLSGMFAQQDRDNGLTMQYGMTTIYTSPEYNWLKSPVGKARSRAAIEEIMRQSPALMNTIASAASVVDNGEEMVQTLLEDITGLFKKQETKETAIADLDAQIDAQGGLDPGQKQIIENFYNKKNEALAASQAADAEAAVEKVGGESEKIKASVKPIFAGLASKVGVAGKLVIPGDKVKTTLDVRAQLNDPLGADPTAELSAKLTFSGTTEGGTSWSAGGGTTAYVSDVYGQQSLDHIKVDWFATARRGAVSTGFFGSVDVPLTERGGSHLLGGAQGGAQLDLSAHITYDITEQTYIRGTAKYTANQAGANLWALGVEGTHQISDNAFLTAGVGVQGGSNEWDRGRTNAAGFGGGTDAYARVGFVIKF